MNLRRIARYLGVAHQTVANSLAARIPRTLHMSLSSPTHNDSHSLTHRPT